MYEIWHKLLLIVKTVTLIIFIMININDTHSHNTQLHSLRVNTHTRVTHVLTLSDVHNILLSTTKTIRSDQNSCEPLEAQIRRCGIRLDLKLDLCLLSCLPGSDISLVIYADVLRSASVTSDEYFEQKQRFKMIFSADFRGY